MAIERAGTGKARTRPLDNLTPPPDVYMHIRVIIGIILGIIALVQSRRAGVKNRPAVAAIIVGAVLFIIGVVIVILAVTVGVSAVNSTCSGYSSGTVLQLQSGGTLTCP